MNARHERGIVTPNYILLTLDQVAGLLGVSRSTVYRILAEGQLESVRVGGRQRVRSDELNRYLSDSLSPETAKGERDV